MVENRSSRSSRDLLSFMFERDKTYRETRLQLLLSPVLLSSCDLTERDDKEDHLKAGNCLLTGLQFRGLRLADGGAVWYSGG